MSRASPTKALHVVVRGRVQGVGFRAFVANEAATRGVTGYVRNLDRSDELEAILCGAVDAVDELLDRLRTGPRSARVVGIELTPLEPAPEYTGFDIRY